MLGYIFLDLDGVLVVERRFTPEAISAFNMLCRYIQEDYDLAGELVIILSSSWRKDNSVEEINDIFKTMGIDKEVSDVTPFLNTIKRSDEILSFINENPCDYWIAIDDGGMFELEELGDRWYKVNPYTGMTADDILPIINRIKSFKP